MLNNMLNVILNIRRDFIMAHLGCLQVCKPISFRGPLFPARIHLPIGSNELLAEAKTSAVIRLKFTLLSAGSSRFLDELRSVGIFLLNLLEYLNSWEATSFKLHFWYPPDGVRSTGGPTGSDSYEATFKSIQTRFKTGF